MIAGAIGAAAMTALAQRQIGGQTGDVAGAAQQWSEIAAWCGLLIGHSAALRSSRMSRLPPISTPCVKICVVDPLSALCIGCGRTVAEIAAWSEMSEGERRDIMAGLDERMRAARSRAARGGRRRPDARPRRADR